MKRKRTFTVVYNYFEPGTYVTPTSSRSVLDAGTYKVIVCKPPPFLGEDSTVFVEGCKYGVTGRYLKEVVPTDDR